MAAQPIDGRTGNESLGGALLADEVLATVFGARCFSSACFFATTGAGIAVSVSASFTALALSSNPLIEVPTNWFL
jgi:hypothetical protein